jgi:EAL and modified HD-GYP domain-containing signal transduction protein
VSFLRSIWRKQEEVEAIHLVGEHDAEPHRDPGNPYPARRFIARQAIFTHDRRVFAYELLCRTGWENRFLGDSDAATRQMIADGALYGFEELVRGTRAFVNCTREALIDRLVTVLPHSTVLEVLETIVPDEPLLEALRELKLLGYKIALDDFRLSDAMLPLIPLADFIKVDFRLSGPDERRELLALLEGSHIGLIAEKVETQEEFDIALTEGFKLFQGYFFCHPTVFSKRATPTNGAGYLQLLSALSQQTFDVHRLTTLVKAEPAICYQLLRLVNSAAFATVHQITSIQDALVLVGEDQFRKLVMNAIATETCRRHPDELLLHVLHRARFLEILAPFTRENSGEQYLFGLLSLMDVMLDMPVDALLAHLPLRTQVKEGLSGSTNAVTAALRLLESYEEGDWSLCTQRAAALHLTEADLTHLYEESLHWAEAAAGLTHRPTAA